MRCCAGGRELESSLPSPDGKFQALFEPDPGVERFWKGLTITERRTSLTVDRKKLFTRIREQFCSRCFGNFQARYDEMKGAERLECAACRAFYQGLRVAESGEIVAEESIITSNPFELFSIGSQRKRERDEQFGTEDICGGPSIKRGALSMCALHSTHIPEAALLSYFEELSPEQRHALVRLREEDFTSELDGALKYELRICRDCRGNVVQAYKNVKVPFRTGIVEKGPLQICEGVQFHVANQCASLEGELTEDFFAQAEVVEDSKPCMMDDLNEDQNVRHAETLDAAREALIDSVLVIFRGQIETAFREQTAGHNALLLFVTLTLQVMEEQLMNAFHDVTARERGAELMDLEDREKKKEANKQAKKKTKKAAKAAVLSQEPADTQIEEQQIALTQPESKAEDESLPKLIVKDDQQNSEPADVPSPRMPSYREACMNGTHPERANEDPEDGWELQTNRRRTSLTGYKRASNAGNAADTTSETSSVTPYKVKDNGETSAIDIPKTKQPLAAGQKAGYMFKGVFVQPPPPPPPPRKKPQPTQPPPPPKPAPIETKYSETKYSVEDPVARPPMNGVTTPKSWTIGAGVMTERSVSVSQTESGAIKAQEQSDSTRFLSSWNPFTDWSTRDPVRGLEDFRSEASRVADTPRALKCMLSGGSGNDLCAAASLERFSKQAHNSSSNGFLNPFIASKPRHSLDLNNGQAESLHSHPNFSQAGENKVPHVPHQVQMKFDSRHSEPPQSSSSTNFDRRNSLLDPGGESFSLFSRSEGVRDRHRPEAKDNSKSIYSLFDNSSSKGQTNYWLSA